MKTDLLDYISKEVSFKFRGIDFSFALSQGLFSSADIDRGTRFLLKVFSQLLDEDIAARRPLPGQILDSGCGIGVIGICAAAAAGALGPPPRVYAQDRDELARLVTLHNAQKNRIPASTLEAHTGPLLSGPEGVQWDLILTNIPAKAGQPVLEDFITRSAGLLKPGGRVVMVAVHTLAGFFRRRIMDCGLDLIREEASTEHSILVYRGGHTGTPLKPGSGFMERYPFYVRASAGCLIEKIPVHLETVHGASGFDNPGSGTLTAAKLVLRLGPEAITAADSAGGSSPVLVYETGQGFFTCWLLEYLFRAKRLPVHIVISGRNIVALEAARHNAARSLAAAGETAASLNIVPAADLRLGMEQLTSAAQQRQYGCIAVFPELVPQSLLSRESDQLASLWAALSCLLQPQGVCTVCLESSDGERFNRKKPPGFTRLGDIRRKGFRAMAFRLTP
ncbi:MAG: methyltransferase [Treponema sp.]|jgi:hypothetical protein|nr:methyltransferase [Treponema sp.]